ncbi:MAG: SOS response-associated peptidase [Patescibacteria group bacterium]|jgi:putative SOS response-associated peptidase YedK
MCGRYSLISSLNELKERFNVKKVSGQLTPRYNAAPSQQLPLIAGDAPQRIVLAEWGIIPAWMKDEKSIKRLINAKAETIAEKRTFKQAAEKRRCLIIADGFYEWAEIPGTKKKQPFRLTLKNNSPFAMAGIYELKKDKNKQYMEFAIITVSANALMAKIHNRMPAILLPEDEKR